MVENTHQVRLYDSTMLRSYRGCRRRFWFRHVLNWSTSGIDAAPGFGICWHVAMDYIWQNLSSEPNPVKLAQGAYREFEREWRELGLPDPDTDDCDKLMPRTPDTAASMLLKYVEQRPQFIRDCEVLDVEIPFVVPLYPDNFNVMYCGKLDKVVRYRGRIWIIDHKTTTLYSRAAGFQQSFTDTFSPNLQIDGYAYAGHMLYGKEFKGVWIDAALVHKTQRHYGLIPVERKIEHLDAWLSEVRRLVTEVETDRTQYEAQRRRGEPFTYNLFIKNDQACYDWNRPCPYLDICKMHADPTEATMPDGMLVEPWSPLEHAGIVDLREMVNVG